MFPEIHSILIQQFYDCLEDLTKMVTSPEPDFETIKQQFQQLEQQFNQKLLPITSDGFNSAIANNWQGLKTEMHRNLRLLKTDFVFFESSLKANKIPKTKRICYHLDQLIAICSLILNEELHSKNKS